MSHSLEREKTVRGGGWVWGCGPPQRMLTGPHLGRFLGCGCRRYLFEV